MSTYLCNVVVLVTAVMKSDAGFLESIGGDNNLLQTISHCEKQRGKCRARGECRAVASGVCVAWFQLGDVSTVGGCAYLVCMCFAAFAL